MRIQQLVETVSRRQPVTPAQAQQLILTRYDQAWRKYLDGDAIYRGVITDTDRPQDVIWQVDPGSQPRVSRNTSNLYTMFVDNDARWQAYPDRSRSLICSSSRSTARGYGNPHVVLLENNAKLGVCASADWWFSFDHMFDVLKEHGNTRMYDISDLNVTLSRAFQLVFGTDINLNNADQLVADLDRLGEYIVHGDHEFDQPVITNTGVFEMLKTHPHSLSDLLSELMDPHANGFELTTMDAYSQPRDREIWSDATALMLGMHAVDELRYMLSQS